MSNRLEQAGGVDAVTLEKASPEAIIQSEQTDIRAKELSAENAAKEAREIEGKPDNIDALFDKNKTPEDQVADQSIHEGTSGERNTTAQASTESEAALIAFEGLLDGTTKTDLITGMLFKAFISFARAMGFDMKDMLSKTGDKEQDSLSNLKQHLATDDKTRDSVTDGSLAAMDVKDIEPFLATARKIDPKVDVSDEDFWPQILGVAVLEGTMGEIQAAYREGQKTDVSSSSNPVDVVTGGLNQTAKTFKKKEIATLEETGNPKDKLRASILAIENLPANIEYEGRQVAIDIVEGGKKIQVGENIYGISLVAEVMFSQKINVFQSISFNNGVFNVAHMGGNSRLTDKHIQDVLIGILEEQSFDKTIVSDGKKADLKITQVA